MTPITSNILQKLEQGYITHSEKETFDCAKALVPFIPHNHTLALHGPLGVGKTTFVKGLAKAWNIEQTVTSPTYTFLSIYKSPTINLIHIDAYRLTPTSDTSFLCLDDFIAPPYCIAIEWPENIPSLIHPNTWHPFFSILQPNVHKIQLHY